MFVQGEYKNLKPQYFYHPRQLLLDNEESNDTDETSNQALPFQPPKSKQTHRRATTNLVQPADIMKNIQTLQPSTQNAIIASNGAVFNDDIGLVEERDKLIKYIKLYTSKRMEVPTTTLDYYKFMKLIGKGAFGKVTLGIHKLTGK